MYSLLTHTPKWQRTEKGSANCKKYPEERTNDKTNKSKTHEYSINYIFRFIV